MEKLRIVLVDDHKLVRTGLKTLFESEPDIVVVGEAATCAEAVELTCALGPDVLLLDLRMPDGDAVDVCAELARREVDTKVLILTAFEDGVAPGDFAITPHGYLLKDLAPEALIHAVKGVAHGTTVFDHRIAAQLIEADGRCAAIGSTNGAKPDLSPRETEILDLMARGLNNKEIAAELWISISTVKTHVGQILHKLGGKDRTQAVLTAVTLGLVHLSEPVEHGS